MSSETSTEPEAFQPWQLFTLAGLIGATIVVFLSRGQSPAAVILLSLTIFTAATVGLAAWRTFIPISATDEPTGSPVLAGRTRAALEREKVLALRSLKELEFDRAMGKVSEKDFAEMGARLRVRAAGLMQQLDAGESYREMIEKDLAGLVRGPRPSSPVASTARHGEGVKPPAKDPIPPTKLCGSCSTVNEADALFCKHCGAGLEPTK